MAKPEDTLTLETTKGKVVIAMRPDMAPGHVARIKELVKEGFYDGIVFHRVIEGFMAQTGCPQGTGTGGSGQGRTDRHANHESGLHTDALECGRFPVLGHSPHGLAYFGEFNK